MNRRILSRYEYNVGDGKLDISGERNNDILHLGSDIQRADFIF